MPSKYPLPAAGQRFLVRGAGAGTKEAYYLVDSKGLFPEHIDGEGIAVRRLIDPIEAFGEDGPARWSRGLVVWDLARWKREARRAVLLPSTWEPEKDYVRVPVVVHALRMLYLEKLYTAALEWNKDPSATPGLRLAIKAVTDLNDRKGG